MAVEMNATVTKFELINHGLLILRVSPDNEIPEFTPGQYTVLGLPGTTSRVDYAEAEEPLADPSKLIKRAYSITSSSKQGEYY